MRAQIAQSQYPLAIRDDDRPYIVFGPVLQDIVDVSSIVDAHEEATGPSIDQTELLTRQAYSWRVHQRHHFTYVLCQQTVEEFLVSVLGGTRLYVRINVRDEQGDLIKPETGRSIIGGSPIRSDTVAAFQRYVPVGLWDICISRDRPCSVPD